MRLLTLGQSPYCTNRKMEIIIFLLGIKSARHPPAQHSLTSEETTPSTLPAFPAPGQAVQGLHPKKTLSTVRHCLGARGHPHPAITGEGSIHRSFPGITFPDNFNAICALEPGSLEQLDPGWELQSISVFTSMFQRYQSSTPSTLHTGSARGSHVELLSTGAQQLSENQPVEERGGKQELRQSHPTKAWISICLSHTGNKNHHQKVRPPATPCSAVDASVSPRQMVGRGRVRRKKEGNKFKRSL